MRQVGLHVAFLVDRARLACKAAPGTSSEMPTRRRRRSRMRSQRPGRFTAVGRASRQTGRNRPPLRPPTQIYPTASAARARQYHAIGGRDADGRRAAHHHIAYRLGHLRIDRIDIQVSSSHRQQTLIEQTQSADRSIQPLGRWPSMASVYDAAFKAPQYKAAYLPRQSSCRLVAASANCLTVILARYACRANCHMHSLTR